MPLVNVMVNGRAYTIACDEGEEGHLKELASHVDAKAREVLASVGQVGDVRMLLMAALLIADEHHELSGKTEVAVAGDGEKHGLHLRGEQAEAAAADALESAAKKLEDVAVRLAHA
jgi:cell division protein ZapA